MATPGDNTMLFKPFSSSLEHGRKVTRKRAQLELARGDFFPSEHHSSAMLPKSGQETTILTQGKQGHVTP